MGDVTQLDAEKVISLQVNWMRVFNLEKDIMTESYTVGRTKNTFFYRNEETEIPNEFQLYAKDQGKKLFYETVDAVNKLISNQGNEKRGNAHMIIKVVMYDQEKKTLQFHNLDNGPFEQGEYNDIDDSIFTFGRTTLDELRYDISCGVIPFAKFLRRTKQAMDCDDEVQAHVQKHESGGVSINRSVLGIQKGSVDIDAQGNIINSYGLKYVKLLQDNNVKVDIAGVESDTYQGVNLSQYDTRYWN